MDELEIGVRPRVLRGNRSWGFRSHDPSSRAGDAVYKIHAQSLPVSGAGAGARFKVQTPPVKPRLSLILATVVGALLAGGACSKQIGDDCSTSADCDPNGHRVCDLSQPGGYCTILGCDETSCPSEATCVRFFPSQFLTTPCNPLCEDQACASQPVDGGAADDAGPNNPACPCPGARTNDCTSDEICLDEGRCAPRVTERRMCMRACGGNGDCRGGYICRVAGTGGSMKLSMDPNVTARFCAPAPP